MTNSGGHNEGDIMPPAVDPFARDGAHSFQLETIQGLSESEAAAILRRDGPNELPSTRPRSLFALALAVLREPMLLLLVGAGVIYLLLGELRDSLALLMSIFVVVAISLYEQHKTERTLEALRDLSSPRARVIRDGTEKRVAGREVVRGDIIVLAEGDRVPADVVVLSNVSLSVDESLLTGESVSVHKDTGDRNTPLGRPGGEHTPFAFSGTMVVQGHGVAVVKATGSKTELGKIGKSLQGVQSQEGSLKVEVNRLAGILATVGLSV